MTNFDIFWELPNQFFKKIKALLVDSDARLIFGTSRLPPFSNGLLIQLH